MLRSFGIGLVAGQRAMTPLAIVAGLAQQGRLPKDAPSLLSHPLVAAGAVALAAAEMAGDKMPSAPDRVVAPGLAARALTAGLAGAALAERGERRAAAALAAGTAVASSFAGWFVRIVSMHYRSQALTGFVEDALVLGGGLAVTGALKPVPAKA